jgi:hypothetical protein
MILTEAKKRAIREYVSVMERTGLTPDEAKKVLDANPHLKRAMYRIPHGDAVGTAANVLLHLVENNVERRAA